MTRPAPAPAAQLPRTIRRGDIAFIVVGSVIGSGIFLVPGGVLRESGSVGMALMVWLAGGLLCLLGALTYAELGAMNPGTGGLYLYVRDAFGRLPAFLYGWVIFFVICPGTVATLAVASSTYLQQFIPLGDLGRKLLALAIVVLITWPNVRGTRLSVVALNSATVLKVAALTVLIIALPLAGSGLAQVTSWWPERVDGTLLQAVGLAMISVLWAYEGWQYTTFVAGETVDPQRSLPGGLFLGTLILLVIYVLTNLGYVAALGPDGVAGSERVAADSVSLLFGPWAATAIAIPIVVAMISAAHSTLLTMPRAFYSMAQDRVFFQRLADVHPRFGTPATAVMWAGVLAGILTLLGTFEELLNWVIFVGWIFYGLAGAAVFVLRKKLPDAPRPFRVPGYPFTPALYVLSAAAIVVNAIVSQPPLRTLAGLGVLAVGVPAYLFWRKR